MNKQVYLFDTVALPLYVKTTEYREYTTVKEKLTEETAKKKAMSLYREKLKNVMGDASLLSKEVTSEADEKGYTVKCELRLLADIAKKAPLVLERTEGIEN